MADLGDVIGSLMVGLIRARRMADEQTAVLAEYYKSIPLLEGLSVPRIRVPELTVEVPMIIEKYGEGEVGKMANPTEIAGAAQLQLKSTVSRNNITVDPILFDVFADELKSRLTLAQQSGASVMRETVVRTVQTALADALKTTKTTLTVSDRESIAKDLRTSVSAASIAKEPVTSSIVVNIITAEVKEKASDTNVVRLKITLKEEGLEWSTQASESGGVIRTLQPE